MPLPPTPILQAELHVAGVRVVCDTTRLEFTQPVDYEGRPNGAVRLALLEVTLSGPAAFLPVWNEFKFNVFRRESGFLLWQTQAGQTRRRLIFFDAPCTALAFALHATGQAQGAAAGLRLRFAPAAVELQGAFVELHSRLAWEPDPAVRRRALVHPFPLPLLSPSPVVPPQPVLPRLIPPELPSLPLGPLLGRALGVIGLVLLPANDADAPGYEAERNLRQRLSPVDKDAARLAYLAWAREKEALSDAEQAEYVALLAKVKGIREVEPLATVSPDFGGEVPMAHSDLGRRALAYRMATGNWHDGNITVFEYYDNKGKLCHLVQSTQPPSKRHAERLALEKLAAEKIPFQNVKRIYSELEPCEVESGGLRGEGCKKMIINNFSAAKITYSYEYRGRYNDTRAQRVESKNRKEADLIKYKK